jgi:hypothetical protein
VPNPEISSINDVRDLSDCLGPHRRAAAGFLPLLHDNSHVHGIFQRGEKLPRIVPVLPNMHLQASLEPVKLSMLER